MVSLDTETLFTKIRPNETIIVLKISLLVTLILGNSVKMIYIVQLNLSRQKDLLFLVVNCTNRVKISQCNLHQAIYSLIYCHVILNRIVCKIVPENLSLWCTDGILMFIININIHQYHKLYDDDEVKQLECVTFLSITRRTQNRHYAACNTQLSVNVS